MQRALFAAVLGIAALAALPAAADVAPPDQCTSPGVECNNALGSGTFGEPGVCTRTTCTRPTPDGSMEYACLRCVGAAVDAGGADAGTYVPPDGGTDAAGGTGSGSGAGAGADRGGGCAVAAPGREGAVAAAMVALGTLALALGRRRRA